MACNVEQMFVFRQVNMDRDVFGADRRYDLRTILGRGSHGAVAQVMDKGSGK